MDDDVQSPSLTRPFVTRLIPRFVGCVYRATPCLGHQEWLDHVSVAATSSSRRIFLFFFRHFFSGVAPWSPSATGC